MDATLMELIFGVHTQPVAYVMLFFINPWMGAVGAARTHAWRKINCIGHISLSLSASLHPKHQTFSPPRSGVVEIECAIAIKRSLEEWPSKYIMHAVKLYFVDINSGNLYSRWCPLKLKKML
jgi:hypothetical protein